MKVYVLDASAVIRYLTEGVGEEKVASLIRRSGNGETRLVVSVINWGEALYSLAKIAGLAKATSDLKTLEHFSYCCRALKGSLNQAFASSAVSSGSSSAMA